MKQILVGSRAFFSGMKGFQSKDRDYLILVEQPQGFNWRREQSVRGICTFQYKLGTPAEMVSKTLEVGDPLLIGKFLVPEVADVLGATIDDILPLETLLPKLDDKHQYEAVIFNAIKTNGSFTLTEEQRKEAFKVYKSARKSDNDSGKQKRKTEQRKLYHWHAKS